MKRLALAAALALAACGSAERPAPRAAAAISPAASPGSPATASPAAASRARTRAGARARAAADPCASAPAAGDHELHVLPGTPTVNVHVPEGLAAGRHVPLVLGLHGAGQDARDFEGQSAFTQVADDEGFVVAYPESWRPRYFWKWPERDNRRSGLRLLRATIRAAAEVACVDRGRVLVSGISSGGRMTYSAGCELADVVLAIAPVSGGVRDHPRCRPLRPVSLLDLHGTADPIVPYRFVRPVLNRWARLNRCTPNPRTRRPLKHVTRLDWRACRAGTRVTHLRISGGGHAWPPLGGPAGIQLDGAEAIWRWFEALPRR